MAEIIDNYLKEYLKVVDDFLKKEGSVVERNYAFFKSFYRRENLEKVEWENLQEMGKHIHSFNSMAIARGNALGKPNQSIEKYREALLYLVYGNDPIDIKINNIQLDKGYSLPYFGRSALSELACYAYPEEYLFINTRDIESAKFLGIQIIYPRKSRAGDKFLAFNKAIAPLIESYKSIIGKRSNTTIPLEVDQFFSWIYTNYVPDEEDIDDDENEETEGVHYWIFAPGKDANKWDEFYNQGVMGIGWEFIGDIRNYKSKAELVKKFQEHENDTASHKNDVSTCWNFCYDLKVGDVIISKKGRSKYLGYGIVESDYIYHSEVTDYSNVRKVRWIKRGEWTEPDGDIVLKTLTNITRYKDYISKLQMLLGIETDKVGDLKSNAGWISMEKFDYKRFIKGCDSASLYVKPDLALRFISSLITKPFLILTGLSGSGKTRLAISYANWITKTGNQIRSSYFEVGEVIKSNRVSYLVTACDKISVILEQSESGIKVSLPYDLINEWIDAIKSNNFTTDTPPRRIRETVESTTKFSLQLNSFETHLKSAAFHLILKSNNEFEQEKYVCVVAVGADWTNREPLLGYPNALVPNKYVAPENQVLSLIIGACNNPNRPYFLILDEMNLSHVERYFADFLSAMESGEPIALHSGNVNWDDIPPAIRLPKNLFIIGTVNIDETTYMFSPKVLDRANVIEFRVTKDEMSKYLGSSTKLDLDSLTAGGASMGASFVEIANDKSLTPKNTKELNDELLKFFVELKKSGAEFGYRSASEMNRFAAVINRLEPTWEQWQIVDAAIMQKLLPKVHGSRKKLQPVLEKLAELCLNDPSIFTDYIKNGSDSIPSDKIKYPVSMEKIGRMYRALLENSFTSYAEA